MTVPRDTMQATEGQDMGNGSGPSEPVKPPAKPPGTEPAPVSSKAVNLSSPSEPAKPPSTKPAPMSSKAAKSTSELTKPPGAETTPVSSKAAKLLGINLSSGPANKKKSGQPGRRSSRRSNKPMQFRPARADLEAGPRDSAASGSPDEYEAPGRTEKILQRLFSRKRNVVLCLIFLFSVVVAVSVVSGFQGKGNATGAAQSTQIPKQNPKPSSSSPPSNSSIMPSPSANTSVGGFRISEVGVGGGQSGTSSLLGRMVHQTYQETAPTSTPL